MGSQYRKKEWLLQKYEEDGWSQNEIAEFCDVTQGTIWKWMKKFGIKSRDMSESHLGKRNGSWVDSPIKDYNWMYREYVLNKRPLRDIAKSQGVGLRTVARWIERHSIPTRSNSEYEKKTGNSNPNWKGGSFCENCGRKKSYTADKCRTCYFEHVKNNPKENPHYLGKINITQSLRSYTKDHWTPEIFKRDNYTCVECGDSKGGNLNAHHIIPFVTLRDQIIFENSNLDINNEDGRLEIIKIGKNDRRINDLDNGITLCESCHIGEHKRIRHMMDCVLYVYRATIVKIIDTDTFVVDLDLGRNITSRTDIRLYGVNAPELHKNDPDYKTSIKGKSILNEICLPGREVLIRTFKSGKYGRWLGLVILDTSYINHILVKRGFAKEKIY